MDLLRLKNEYRYLTQLSRPASPQELAEAHASAFLPRNRAKNRYPDVLPLEATRVKLNDMSGGESYINANFVQSEHRFVAICTQAPLPHTFHDFWRMVWEQQVGVIVILMRLRENGKVKGNHYWPVSRKEPKTYGDITVSLRKSKQVEQTRVRIFQISKKDETRQRRVVQLHFKGWPDQGVPESTQPIRELIHLMHFYCDRAKIRDLPGPVLIHCSAGIGRTGTFLAIVFALEKLFPHKKWWIEYSKKCVSNSSAAAADGSSSESHSYLTSDNTDANDSDEPKKRRADTTSEDESDDMNDNEDTVVVYDSDAEMKDSPASAAATPQPPVLPDRLIPDIVLSLRKQRNRGMVQTEEQYLFIYKAVLDELASKGLDVSDSVKVYMNSSKRRNDIGVIKKKSKKSEEKPNFKPLSKSGSWAPVPGL